MKPTNISRRTAVKSIGSLGAIAAISGGGLGLLSGRAAAADTWTLTDPTTFTSPDGQINKVNVNANYLAEWFGFDIPVAAVAWRDVITLNPSAENIQHVLYDAVPGNGGYPGPSAGLVHVLEFVNQSGGSWGGSGTGAVEIGGGEWSEDTSPTTPWAEGRVHADIDWDIIVGGAAADGTFDPYNEGDEATDPLIVEATASDGELRETTVEYVKELHFFADIADTGDAAGSGTMTQGSTAEVVPMPTDKGIQTTTAVDTFVVSVQNEESSTDTSGGGDGSTS